MKVSCCVGLPQAGVTPVGNTVCLLADLNGDSSVLISESIGPDPPPTAL